MFSSKKLLITGGTGSFGNAILQGFLDSEISEIRIFSRDEKKQDDMRKNYNNSKLKFYIGDVRDRDSLKTAMKGIDYVFHAAALKQVPSCEFYPIEAVKTNILGTENVIDAAIDAKVKKVICLSTDKAVYPINAMGISKSMMEKVVVSKSRNLSNHETTICATRYGNVMSSRGSVIPLFIDQIKRGDPLTITDPTMTRFMMSLADAVNLVMYAFKNGKNGDIFVQKSPASTIGNLADALTELFGKKNYPIDIIGARHGEKLFEVLVGSEELARAKDIGKYYQIPSDTRDLNYSKFSEQGEKILTESLHGEDYNSHNTERLNLKSMQELLLGLEILKRELPS